MTIPHYSIASTEQELQQILALQQLNLAKSISTAESKSQGFVTIEHKYEILKTMNDACPHIIAKANGEVVGYTLVMLEQFKDQIPILIPMFERVNRLQWKDRTIGNLQYFTMGQVCIAKAWRGQGVFSGLYQHMKVALSDQFDGVITEIATRNTRSMRAHEKVGFEVLEVYQAEVEEWAIVGWDWR